LESLPLPLPSLLLPLLPQSKPLQVQLLLVSE
jgi:hypothetical protein